MKLTKLFLSLGLIWLKHIQTVMLVSALQYSAKQKLLY